jgi:hypothetical protein
MATKKQKKKPGCLLRNKKRDKRGKEKNLLDVSEAVLLTWAVAVVRVVGVVLPKPASTLLAEALASETALDTADEAADAALDAAEVTASEADDCTDEAYEAMLDVTDATTLDRSVVAVVVVSAAAGDVVAADASDRTLEMAEDASLRIELTEEPSHLNFRTESRNGKEKETGRYCQ